MLKYFEEYARKKYYDYIEDSGYLCEDGITFMFKIESDISFHVLIFDLTTSKIIEV